MGHRSLKKCVLDLERANHLIRVQDEIDPHLEAAEIQRRVFQRGGPALLFDRVKGCQYPMVSNLFGNIERARYMFRDTYEIVQRLIELKIQPDAFLKKPLRFAKAPFAAANMLPKRVKQGPVLEHQTTISQLPLLKSWPDDGGAFVTLPQVYTEDVEHPGYLKSNLGMYRIQLTGNEYETDKEIGLHYQLHRGIGVHHTKALRAGKPLRVNIFVGGNPAMTLAAVMPLPEGMSELTFAGALAGHRIPLISRPDQIAMYAQADFCISGTVSPEQLKPEGPFGDHLGYYSLTHDFPVLQVDRVFHRADAIWPFTVVGRPPQEDTIFGELIHDLTGPVVPTVVPGVHAVHAVDAAGVHPLMLAIGSERYVPWAECKGPQEILTQANAILGQGQMSLAKYLLILNRYDDPGLDIQDIGRFFRHLLCRVDWNRDLHFQTRTTIDTLDYSGTELNEGSKVVIAAAGRPVRELPTELPSELQLPDGYSDARIVSPGVLSVKGPAAAVSHQQREQQIEELTRMFTRNSAACQFPLWIVVDDSDFTARNLSNFLWVTFTRSNPATDIYGVDSFVEQKHWGCRGSLVIDARIKPHHAPPLIEDPDVCKRVDALAARGGPLSEFL